MAKIHKFSESEVCFHCPGCQGGHMVRVSGEHPVWGWNGSYTSPTFTPSILLRSGHYSGGHSETCWCTYNKEHPESGSPFKCSVCHSFVTDGKIQFLADSTHTLSGQTVEIPDWDES